MTIWITGANGFIGRHLARLLADGGQVVDGIGHGTMGEEERQRSGLREWMSAEISGNSLRALGTRTSTPSLIFHLAGGASVGASIARPHEDFVRSVMSTAHLLEWIRATAPQCRLILVSSAAVYGTVHFGPIAESTPPAPVSPYGYHKMMSEELCRSYSDSYGVQATIVRLFSVYGPMLRKQLLWDLCCRLQSGTRTLLLDGTGEERRDWTSVRDVVRLLARLGTEKQHESIALLNGGTGIATNVRKVAETVMSCWNKEISVHFSGISRPGDPFSLVSDTTKLNRLAFRWEVPAAQGIEDYVRWFRAYPPS